MRRRTATSIYEKRDNNINGENAEIELFKKRVPKRIFTILLIFGKERVSIFLILSFDYNNLRRFRILTSRDHLFRQAEG